MDDLVNRRFIEVLIYEFDFLGYVGVLVFMLFVFWIGYCVSFCLGYYLFVGFFFFWYFRVSVLLNKFWMRMMIMIKIMMMVVFWRFKTLEVESRVRVVGEGVEELGVFFVCVLG